MTGGRRRARLAGVLGTLSAAAITFGAGAASAQIILHDAEDESQPYQTPQHWALELRFGPFRPNIDSEFTTGTPYKTYFGSGNHLMSQVELDFQIFHGFGSAAVGASIGYFSQSANAFLAADPTLRSGDKTTLLLLPLSVSAVYRFDVLAERHRIPLIPYAKAGLDYTFWSITDGNGNVAHWTSDDKLRAGTGQGGTPGWHAAAGMTLLLDVFDPGAARELDSEIGVNHTHLFVEGGYYNVTGFGAKGKLRVGDTTWLGGIMFEF